MIAPRIRLGKRLWGKVRTIESIWGSMLGGFNWLVVYISHVVRAARTVYRFCLLVWGTIAGLGMSDWYSPRAAFILWICGASTLDLDTGCYSCCGPL